MKTRSDKEIEEIIESASHIKRAEVSPYFKTKLIGKIQSQQLNVNYSIYYYIIAAASMILFFLNAKIANQNTNTSSNEYTIQENVVTNPYQLNTTTYNYDIKKQ